MAESVERIEPENESPLLIQEHMARYLLAASFVRQKRVLDAACGNGYAAPVFLAAGAQSYCGVDVSPEAVRHAKKFYENSRAVFHNGDASVLAGISDESIDVAVSFETIEHVQEPESLLQNVRRVLTGTGLFLVSTPNRWFDHPELDLDDAPLNPFHIREWNQAEFLDLIRKYFHIRLLYGQYSKSAARVRLSRILRRVGIRRSKNSVGASSLPSECNPLTGQIASLRPGIASRYVIVVAEK